MTRAAPRRAPPSSSTCSRRAFAQGPPGGPWRNFACDLPVDSIRPKETFVASNRMAGSGRKADVADHGLGRLNWAVSAPTAVASGRTGVRATAAIPLRARNWLRRTQRKSTISPASGHTQRKPEAPCGRPIVCVRRTNISGQIQLAHAYLSGSPALRQAFDERATSTLNVGSSPASASPRHCARQTTSDGFTAHNSIGDATKRKESPSLATCPIPGNGR